MRRNWLNENVGFGIVLAVLWFVCESAVKLIDWLF